jgi:hypothetical protein
MAKKAQPKPASRDEIKSAVSDYLARGGKIKKVESEKPTTFFAPVRSKTASSSLFDLF